jgi:hypothetical protein
LAEWLKIAIRPELYIKIAIVILGAFIAVTMVGKLTLASSLMLRGLAAIVEAYLIYWPVVYLIARKGFGFSREWSAPLASGVAICGVAAAIATGGAIRARPQVPVLVSSLGRKGSASWRRFMSCRCSVSSSGLDSSFPGCSSPESSRRSQCKDTGHGEPRFA